jgi:hypothetical protein
MLTSVKTVITISFLFPNHGAPGQHCLGFQKTFLGDLSISKGMPYELRLFKQRGVTRIEKEVSNVKILDRGEILIKEVVLNFSMKHSIQELFDCESKELQEEMYLLGFKEDVVL